MTVKPTEVRRSPKPIRPLGVVIGLVAMLATALAIPAAAGTSASTADPPSGFSWADSPSEYRGKDGTRATFVCPADGKPSSVWGTDTYTDDSSVCGAAQHAGKLDAADGGTVTIEMRPGLAAYTGSTRNGVTTANYGSWSSSFVVVGVSPGGGVSGVKMGGGGWTDDVDAHRGSNGSRYRYVCPAGGTADRVWGTNVYTDDTSVCTAAVQVGLISLASGGNVTIEVRPGQQSYVSFTHNGIKSLVWGSWQGSFVFAGAAPIPGSPGGGGGGGGTTTTTPGGTAGAPPTATTTGTVLVNGQPFTSGTIPYRATVDVTEGSVLLKADVGTLKASGADGISAVFVLLRAKDGKKPVVELRLTKGDFRACPKRKTSSAQAAATVVRQLWGDGKGSFRTRGRYASATVRGTKWLTTDRCDGTNVKVQRGVIQVADLPQRTQVTVRAGRSYLARP